MASTGEQPKAEGPRPFTISHDDHRGAVMSIAVLFICYALMLAGMRLAARLKSIGWDDWLSILATGLAVTQFAVIVASVQYSFGTSLEAYSAQNSSTVARMLRASDILLLLALFMAKCAVIWLTRRLFSINQKISRVICDITAGLAAIWCLGSMMAISINCDPEAALGLDHGTCSGLLKRWTLVGVFDALLEVFMTSLSVLVVWPLRMTLSRRVQALSCFLLRLPIIVFIVLHIQFLKDFTHDSNKGVAVTKPVIFRQSQLLFSLFSAAIPGLNQYLRKFQTTGVTTFGYKPNTYGPHSYAMKSYGVYAKGSVNDDRQRDDFAPASQRHYKVTTSAMVDDVSREENLSQDGGSVGRAGSQEMIIRKEIKYEISYGSDGDRPSRA